MIVGLGGLKCVALADPAARVSQRTAIEKYDGSALADPSGGVRVSQSISIEKCNGNAMEMCWLTPPQRSANAHPLKNVTELLWLTPV